MLVRFQPHLLRDIRMIPAFRIYRDRVENLNVHNLHRGNEGSWGLLMFSLDF